MSIALAIGTESFYLFCEPNEQIEIYYSNENKWQIDSPNAEFHKEVNKHNRSYVLSFMELAVNVDWANRNSSTTLLPHYSEAPLFTKLNETIEWTRQSYSHSNENIIDKIIQFNLLSRLCLLYTSPSPRDRTRSRMPSSA